MINLDYLKKFVTEEELEITLLKGDYYSKELDKEQGTGNDYLGWVKLPSSISNNELNDIIATAKKIKDESEYLVVIGIGGSYLGSKAVIEALKNPFEKNQFKVIYAGHTISSTYMNQLLEFLKDKSFSVNVISKSGTTTEPAIAFRLLKKLLIEKFGEVEANSRIYATTDKSKGALRNMANKNNYKSFSIPDNIGGRYSVLTPVGLLPISAAGFDILSFVKGAKDAELELNTKSMNENSAILYAAIRNILYNKGKVVELFVSYEPSLVYLMEWLKQLFGESEGKDQKGIFPASVNFSTDLHSMGQYIQDGRRSIFETVIHVKNPQHDVVIPYENDDLDGLNYIASKTMNYVNQMAEKGTLMAHVEGNVPNVIINIDRIDEYNLGYLMYFFEKTCGISGNILGVNPFNQPGVEAYKKNMFELLGKK